MTGLDGVMKHDCERLEEEMASLDSKLMEFEDQTSEEIEYLRLEGLVDSDSKDADASEF